MPKNCSGHCIPPLIDTSQQQCVTLMPPHNILSTFKPFSSIFSFTKSSLVINCKVHWPDNRHNRCNCLKLFHSSIISRFQRLPSNRNHDQCQEVQKDSRICTKDFHELPCSCTTTGGRWGKEWLQEKRDTNKVKLLKLILLPAWEWEWSRLELTPS